MIYFNLQILEIKIIYKMFHIKHSPKGALLIYAKFYAM
jgi:hypothetical protein